MVSLIFLKRSLAFPVLLFSPISSMITEEGFLNSPCYSFKLCILMGISFLFSFAFCFSPFTAICKASSDNHFAILHFFFLGMVDTREGTQPHTSTENWIKDLLSTIPPIRRRLSFPLSQSLPSGSFHKPPILRHQRADRLKTTITEN